MSGSKIVDALYELYKRKEVSYEIWEKMDSFHDELVRQKIIKEHPCKSKRKQYKEINFKIWEKEWKNNRENIKINKPNFKKLEEKREEIEKKEKKLKDQFKNFNKVSQKTLNTEFDV